MHTDLQNKRIENNILILLLICNALFLAYWLMLAFNSRPHYDDLHFLWRMKEQSIFEYVREMYMTRSGRFFGYLSNAIHSKLIILTGQQWFIPITYYVIGVAMCWGCAADRFKSISREFLFLSILFVYNLYILTNIDFPVFTWVCATSYYILGPSLCLIIHYLNKPKLSPFKWLIFSLLVLFIGGGNEAFTPMVLLVMFVNGMFLWKSYDWNIKQAWNDYRIQRIVFTALVLLCLFVIVVAAPGNYSRLEEVKTEAEFAHTTGIVPFIIGICKAIATYLYFMAFYIPYYLVAGVLGYYCGIKSNSTKVSNYKKSAGILITTYCIYTIFSVVPTVYIYGGFGIQRTYTHNVFFLVALFVAIGYVLGNGKKWQRSSSILATGIIAICIVMSINLFKDTKAAQEYSNAVDERAELLEHIKQQGNTELVYVKPFPHSYTTDVKYNILKLLGKKSPKPVLFYESDTETVPNEYEYHYMRYHQLPFDFVIDPKYIEQNQ